jgi:hypothetical protein
LGLQSAAERQTCVELEADALCDEILNRHEVRRTPLRDARVDVIASNRLSLALIATNRRYAARHSGTLERT